jgi:hypothetical protein
MSKGIPWSARDEKKLGRILTKATTVEEAVAMARDALPHITAINANNLSIKCARLFERPLTAFISANAVKAAADSKKKEQRPFNAPPKPDRDQLAEHRMRARIAELEGKNEKLLKELHDAKEQNARFVDLRALKQAPAIVAPRGRGEGKQRLGVPVMLCSDWHVEEPVEPATVNGLNKYNLEIADECIDKMAEAYAAMIDMTSRTYDCRTGVLWLGGDLFSGYIHDELIEANFLSPTRAMAWLMPRIEKMIRKILALCPRIEKLIVVCNDGNHGRNTHKIRIATRTANSLEWFLYHELAQRFRDEKRVVFQVAEGEYSYLDVFDQTLCFFHGDSVKYAGGVGGLLVPMKRGLNELRKYRPVHVFNAGHFHQYTNHQDIVVNGSMIGLNAYAMRYKFSPEPRQQAWYMLDATRGKCLSAPIWLPQYKP